MNIKNALVLLGAFTLIMSALVMPVRAQTADLSISLSDSPDPVAAGSTITYTISLSNLGPDAASSVTLADALPFGLAFLSLSSPEGWSCSTPPVGMGGAISCSTASLASASTPSFTLDVQVDPLTGADFVITNTATVSSATADPNPANDSASASTTTRMASADLSVNMVPMPNPVAAGATLNYSMSVTNMGPDAASSAVVTDTLPTGTTFLSLASPEGWSCTTPEVGAGGTITCSTAALASGSAPSFTLDVKVESSLAEGAVIANTATASSATPDPNPATNTATASVAATIRADLSVAMLAAPDPVPAGGSLSYTITLSNTGPSDAAGVALNDTLPSGVTFAELSYPAGWSCSTPAAGETGAISCSLASFAGGDSAQFTLGVKVDSAVTAGTAISNIAVASASVLDPDEANNSAMASATVSEVPPEPCQLQVIPSRVLKFIEVVKPLQFFILITEEGKLFSRSDKPVWNSAAIRHLLKLKLGSRMLIELAFINPFTSAKGFYEVTAGACTGTVELL